MSATTPTSALSSIVDNQGENTLLHALERRTERGRELAIASAFFSLDALNLLGPKLHEYARIRLLFGGDRTRISSRRTSGTPRSRAFAEPSSVRRWTSNRPR